MTLKYIENKTFDELQVGESAELTRTLSVEDIDLFAVVSGDFTPAHGEQEHAKPEMFHEVIAHGMWGGALISAVLCAALPGPGTIYLNQSLSFRKPVRLGDVITSRVTVKEKTAKNRWVLLDCVCLNQDGETVISSVAEVIAPDRKIRLPRVGLPESRRAHYGRNCQCQDYVHPRCVGAIQDV